jgi:hypothetical protein
MFNICIEFLVFHETHALLCHVPARYDLQHMRHRKQCRIMHTALFLLYLGTQILFLELGSFCYNPGIFLP